MSPELLAYPFLFIAIFFESFVLVTFLSAPARSARARSTSTSTPSVAVIVPCWNEAATVAATVDSLLALDYPANKLEIVLVDDGSTDHTQAAMARFNSHPQVQIITKENGGKHTALNAGIAATKAEIVGCLDADSFVETSALRELVGSFDDPKVMATTAAMTIHQPGNILQHMQNAEYSFGITLRHTFASVGGLYVTPGPFSFYRRSVVEELGGFRYGNQAEDMEMALRIQRAGYGIDNVPHARVYTKAPATLMGLVKQRTRWISGFLRNILGEYRDLIGRGGALGSLVLPAALISISSAIVLFFIMIYIFARNVLNALEIREGIPLGYALLPHATFDWFYFPGSMYLLLAITLLIASVSLIFIGRTISKAPPGKIALGVASYICFYGFIVPIWLIRATSDVAFGIRRGWRS